MKYVEAMIQPVGGSGNIGHSRLDDALEALSGYLGEFDGELDITPGDAHNFGVGGAKRPAWSRVIELTRKLTDAAESLGERLDYHECAEHANGPLAPVGSNESIGTLLRRQGFISADMVAIVKLADIKDLSEQQP